jgi:hypothetical protein
VNREITKWSILGVPLAILFLSLGQGMAVPQQAETQPAATSPMLFNPHSSLGDCPKGVHAKEGCILVTAKNNDKRAFWTKLRRRAFLGVPATGVPAGCMGAGTAGSLFAAQGELPFTGTGYYCPNAETAVYHCSFDETESKKFGMPVNFTISYEGGRKNLETLTLNPPN